MPPYSEVAKARVALHRLLVELFDADEFLRWIRMGPADDVILDLPTVGSSINHLVDRFIVEMEKRGAIDEDFFLHITSMRPHREEEVGRIASMWRPAKSKASVSTRPSRPSVIPTVILSCCASMLFALVVARTHGSAISIYTTTALFLVIMTAVLLLQRKVKEGLIASVLSAFALDRVSIISLAGGVAIGAPLGGYVGDEASEHRGRFSHVASKKSRREREEGRHQSEAESPNKPHKPYKNVIKDPPYAQTPVCGNNRKEGDEPCDGYDLDGLTCADLGFSYGELNCSDDCYWDSSKCHYECEYLAFPMASPTEDDYVEPFECPGGVVMGISGTFDEQSGHLTITSPEKSGGFDPGTYRVLVFDGKASPSSHCKNFNVVKAVLTLEEMASSLTFPAFDSLLECDGAGESYCIAKEVRGDRAHFCSVPLSVTYTTRPLANHIPRMPVPGR